MNRGAEVWVSYKPYLPKLAVFLLAVLMAVSGMTGHSEARPRPRRKVRNSATKHNPLFLLQVNLTLQRLIVAQAVSNRDLSIAELDQARKLKSEFDTWLEQQGPAWNSPQMKEAQRYVDELLKFSELRLQAEYGLADNMGENIRYFLQTDYSPPQKVMLLLFAANTQLERGKLRVAAESFAKARELARESQQLGPVAQYSLRTLAVKLKTLEDGPLPPAQLKVAFARATEPLKAYSPKVYPVQDTQWLLGRQATRFWTEQLSQAGPEGQESLVSFARFLKRVGRESQKKWNDQELAAQKIVFPYAGYIKLAADLALLSSHADQVLAVAEALPEEAARNAISSEELGLLEVGLAVVPETEKHFADEKLGAHYQSFPISQQGLVPELSGRLKLFKARYQDSGSERIRLLREASGEISKSYDVARKQAYLLQIGDLLAAEGETGEALANWEKALKLAEENGLSLDFIETAERLAGHFAAAEKWDSASSYAQRALEEIEQAIPLAGGDSQTAERLRISAAKLTALAARSAIGSKNTEAALMALAKGQQYEAATSQLSARKETTAEIAEVEKQKQTVAVLDKKVATLKAMPSSETRDALLKESEKLLADSRSEFLLASRNIRQKHSALYSSVLRFDPLNLPDVQKDLAEDTAVVQYFPTESQLYLFLVTRADLKLLSVGIGKSELDKKCGSFLKSLSRLEEESKVLKSSQELYTLLLAPFEEQLKQRKRLVFIPAGNLNFLPFGALCNKSGTPLLVNHSFVELAKPTDFSDISKSEPLKVDGVTAFANATLDLPASAKEAEAIASLFDNSKLFMGMEATKSAFLANGSRSGALHIATHGQCDANDALKSHLKLANGEKVAQEEILTLVLEQTPLVTLSACNTAVSNNVEANYVASLAEAFWLAGSPSVVASLWSVEDESTKLLMTEFYNGLQSGKSKVEALREAQLSVYNTPKFQHPAYWSGFVLFGDWR